MGDDGTGDHSDTLNFDDRCKEGNVSVDEMATTKITTESIGEVQNSTGAGLLTDDEALAVMLGDFDEDWGCLLYTSPSPRD